MRVGVEPRSRNRDHTIDEPSRPRCRHVGRTSQRLQDSIKKHIPRSKRNAACSQTRSQPKRDTDCKSSTQFPTNQSLFCDSTIGLHVLFCDSTIGLHVLPNPICAQNYDDKQFSILAKCRSPFHFILVAIFIKTSNPILCRQKEFVYNLTLLSH